MHEPVRQGLERYLQDASTQPEVESHLAECAECRAEVRELQTQSALLRSLRAPREAEPRPGFYARVLESIDARRRPTFWSGFLEPAFAKRIALASATFLVLLGSFLVVTRNEDADPLVAEHPEAVFVQGPAPQAVLTDDQVQDPNAVLVNLSTYREPVGGGVQ